MIEVVVLLADYAERSPTGKIYAMGLGWESAPTPLPAHALVVYFRVPWDQTNMQISFTARLVGEDGDVVTVPAPVGSVPVSFDGRIEVGRPPGVKAGHRFNAPFVFNASAGIPVLPGRYEWRVDIPPELGESGVAGFTVLAPRGGVGPPLPGLPSAG